MPRTLVYPLQEILSKDINNLRNTADKTLLDVVLGNALPRLPAFIGGSFRVSISGSNVIVSPGICFQNIPQTDGSANTRIIHLEIAESLAINLPGTSGITKRDLVECRSIIENLPEESRKYDQAGTVVRRNTVTMNKWSAEVRIKENVVADAQGNYQPSLGWVAVALVESTNTSIQRVTDHRNYYNLFDPDFFSVYGRKNISFHKAYDGVLLIEVPFEFSDLVPKLQQISVRRLTKEKYGAITVTDKHNTNFALNEPADRRTLKPRNQLTFNGHNPWIVTLNTQNRTNTQTGQKYTFLDRLDVPGGWVDSTSFNDNSNDQHIWGGRCYICF